MNAIILAAGKGSRLLPLTLNVPKPLITINGLPIIERQILFLIERGIQDIYVVVGYLAHCFDYLNARYGVKLLYNEKFDSFNNIYSLFIAKAFFGDTWIIEGDSYLKKNVLLERINCSTYFSGFKKKIKNEWILRFNPANKLVSILIPNGNDLGSEYKLGAYITSGISYWNCESARIILMALEEKMEQVKIDPIGNSIKDQYWDQLVLENLHKLTIKVENIDSNDWQEIDTVDDLNSISF